jgi:hypothetical protein
LTEADLNRIRELKELRGLKDIKKNYEEHDTGQEKHLRLSLSYKRNERSSQLKTNRN